MLSEGMKKGRAAVEDGHPFYILAMVLCSRYIFGRSIQKKMKGRIYP
jgi:hypothetical protein